MNEESYRNHRKKQNVDPGWLPSLRTSASTSHSKGPPAVTLPPSHQVLRPVLSQGREKPQGENCLVNPKIDGKNPCSPPSLQPGILLRKMLSALTGKAIPLLKATWLRTEGDEQTRIQSWKRPQASESTGLPGPLKKKQPSKQWAPDSGLSFVTVRTCTAERVVSGKEKQSQGKIQPLD